MRRTEAFRTALRELDEELTGVREYIETRKVLDVALHEFLRAAKGPRGWLLRGPLAAFRKHYDIFINRDFARVERRVKILEKCRDALEESERSFDAGLPRGLRVVCKSGKEVS